MDNSKRLLAGLVAAGFAVLALPASAEVYINIDPPARRDETHENRAGYIWIPGAWQWKNNKHHWVPGRYLAERKGYRWEHDRWVRHDNNKWTMQRGGWSRDSDGDGVPDRNDAQPNNPRRQ
jgi:hypothetical protein